MVSTFGFRAIASRSACPASAEPPEHEQGECPVECRGTQRVVGIPVADVERRLRVSRPAGTAASTRRAGRDCRSD